MRVCWFYWPDAYWRPSAFVHGRFRRIPLIRIYSPRYSATGGNRPRVTLGALLRGGFRKRSASTSTKAHGTLTPGTGTTAGCSSFSPPGSLWVEETARVVAARYMADYGLTWHRPASSYTGRGSSIGATAIRGANGGRRGYAA